MSATTSAVSWPQRAVTRSPARIGSTLRGALPPRQPSDVALVALTEGWQWIAGYGETWIAYRTASERMKRERRLYLSGAGSYRGLDDDAAFLQLVESVEAILAEEQQVYWRNRGGEGGATRQTGSTAPEKEPEHP